MRFRQRLISNYKFNEKKNLEKVINIINERKDCIFNF